MNSVSCATPIKCIAVGGFNNQTGNPNDSFKSLVLQET